MLSVCRGILLSMKRTLKTVNYEQSLDLTVRLGDCLPHEHLARFVVDSVALLDLSALYAHYGSRGGELYAPGVLLGLLFYGYTTGVFSSRKIERATYEAVKFRFIAGNQHPDHDTPATYLRTFLPELKDMFVQVLLLAQEAQVLKLGTISLDGTKLHADASRHKAVSYKRLQELETQLRAEIEELFHLSEQSDKRELNVLKAMPWPCTFQNILRGIDIAVCNSAAERTHVSTDRQTLLYNLTAFEAILGGEARIDSYHPMTSSLSLFFEDAEKCAPTSVHDALCQGMILDDVEHLQLLNSDDLVMFSVVFRCLSVKVTTLTSNLEMRLRGALGSFPASLTAFLASAYRTLLASQGTLRGTIEERVSKMPSESARNTFKPTSRPISGWEHVVGSCSVLGSISQTMSAYQCPSARKTRWTVFGCL